MRKNNFLTVGLFLLLVSMLSCSEHANYDVTEHTVDYRVSGGIAELYDCALRKRYFVEKIAAYDDLKLRYLALKLKRNDDAFLHVMGYVKKGQMIEGVDPVDVFVATELLSIDPSRGCQLE